MRSLDWAATPLGPVGGWPQSLKTARAHHARLAVCHVAGLGGGIHLLLQRRLRPDDARSQASLGAGPVRREVWSEIWDDIGPRAESVIRTGQATWDEGLLLFLERRGSPEETYHTFSYSPAARRPWRRRGYALRGHGGHGADHRRAAAADAPGTGGTHLRGGEVRRGSLPERRLGRWPRIPTTSHSSWSICSTTRVCPAGRGHGTAGRLARRARDDRPVRGPRPRSGLAALERPAIGTGRGRQRIWRSGSGRCGAGLGPSPSGKPSWSPWRSPARRGLPDSSWRGSAPG